VKRTDIRYKPSFPKDYRPGLGIVGCGRIVKSGHRPGYKRYGQRVVGVYDVRPEATEGLCEQFGVEAVFADLEELLNHPEIEIVDCRSAEEGARPVTLDEIAA
jgi:predicted dehydrogenase